MSIQEPGKGQRYLDLLDTARCNGRWEEVPELARKVEKHVPNRKCLILTARAEHQIASESLNRPSTSSSLSTAIRLSNRIPELLSAAESEKNFPEDALGAQICLGWLHWTIGEPRLALSRIPSNIANLSAQWDKDGRVISRWTHASIVKGAFIRGVSQEHAGAVRDAVETYQSMLPQLAHNESISKHSHEHRLWTERLLSRYCVLIGRHVGSQSQTADHLLLSKSQIKTSSILPPFRAWATIQASETENSTGSIRTNEVAAPRRHIWQMYYNTLSVLMQLRQKSESRARKGHLKSQNAKFNLQFSFDSKLAQSSELKRVETAYESVLLKEISFPKANDLNVEVEELVDQIMSNWVILNGPDWEEEDIEHGGKSALGRRVLATLYRAATRTFHSTRILRHLFTVHTALAEFDLATKALNTYLEIVARGKARVEKSGKTETGLDDDSTVLLTAAAGIRMLCIHGRREEVERSQEIIRLTEMWLAKHRTDTIHRPVRSAEDVPGDLVDQPTTASAPATDESIAAAYRALGLGHCCWSRLTYSPSERGELQQKAVSSLQIASERSLAEDSKTETFYCLALAQAQKRDIDAAVVSVKGALSSSASASDDSSDDDTTDDTDEAPRNMAPAKRRLLFKCWHLLSLLLTAKTKFDAAIESSEAAFDLYGGSLSLFGDQQPGRFLSTLSLLERRDVLELKMTQLALQEVIDGPEEAVNASGELLSLYAKMFQYSELPKVNVPSVSTASPPESADSAPRSIRESVFGRSHIFRSGNRKSHLAVGAADPNSTMSQLSPHETGATPTIEVTSDGARDLPAETHHHHHIFHHESKKLRKRDSRKNVAAVSMDRTASPPRLPTTKSTKQPNFNLPSRSRPSTANSSNQRSVNSDHYASDEVGIAVSYNGSIVNHGSPTGLDGGPSVATLSPISLNKGLNATASFPKSQTPKGNPDSLSCFVTPLSPAPDPIFDVVDTKRHSLTLLVKIWCLMAALYRRASMPTDAAASLEEAETHIKTIEALVVKQKGSSNATLVTPGWAGAKPVAELWADVLAEKAMLHLSKQETCEAIQAYEQALLWWLDHLASTVGLCNLLLDTYEASTKPNPHPPSSFPSPPSSLFPKSTPDVRPLKKIDSTEALSRLAARDRAYGLLSALTKSGQGWDCSEAWLALARAYELGGQIDRAKEALWWVVELEEGRGLREWSVVGGW